MSKRRNQRAVHAPAWAAPLLTMWQKCGLAVLAVLYFLIVCLLSTSTVKAVTLLLIFASIAAVFLAFSRLRSRLNLPLAALTLVVLMDGISTFYAISGKFALYEFLKVFAAFCLSLLLMALPDETEGEGGYPGRRAAMVLEGFSALAGLVSIDLLSTRWISSFFLAVLGIFTPDYMNLSAVEEGVRMTSVFTNPNVFAGCVGIGVLLSLGLAVSAQKKAERAVHLSCLFVSALAFLLAFSMGASGVIALAFLAYLLLEKADRRPALLLLMVETLVITVAAAAVVSTTSFSAWSGFQPVPLLCVAAGAAALWAVDHFLGRRLAAALQSHGRLVLILTGIILAAVAAFALLAYNLTGGIDLQAGELLRRSAYPAPGTYTMTAEATGALSVTIESQNQQETMMHTSTILYEGDISGAAFTVPEDSLVVYFNFAAGQDLRLESAGFQGEAGAGSIPLGYKLLPSFIANRLQGLFANQNAIQRLVFFSDGMKLFRRSPVVGLGMGAFESGIKSVQSFYYETKYVHNHYIQALLETGIVGMLLFIGLLAVSAAAVWFARRREDTNPLVPALGAALVFMAGHAFTEVTFSTYAYLPIAFGTFALISLCCGDAIPVPWLENDVRSGVLAGISALMIAFGILLGGNMSAQNLASRATTFSDLTRAVGMDKYEWADYMLGYVNSAINVELDEATRLQADAYAARLSKVDSNTIPIYLAEYYLSTGRTGEGMEMVEKYVNYVSSDQSAWQNSFYLLEQYASDTPPYRAGVARIAGLLEEWNAQNMGAITLSEQSMAFIARMTE